MPSKIEHLKTLLGEISDLYNVIGLLEWDQQVNMPTHGAEARSHHLSTLYRLYHLKFTSPELGRALEDARAETANLDPNSHEARIVKVAAQMFAKKTRVPPEWVADFAQTVAIAQHVWEQSRPENDFPRFRPHLEKIVALRQQYASFFAPYEHIYDPLLDEFEPGMKTAEVQSIFGTLRPQQVALLQAIAERPQVDASFLYQPYEAQKQWDFGVEVVTRFGYDWKAGRQDKAAHPFTMTVGANDVRITTRILPEYIGSALFSTMHEAGHAMYELGIDPALARTSVGRVNSLALHESQSRTWENLVGRSRPFWEHFYSRLQSIYPSQLGTVSLDRFYKGINQVKASPIRVEADEATYNLHIMLRLELEIALMEGKLAVADLPEAWNAGMQSYLGITPANDADGVLQDIHWSNGYFGYFATYALGNLISAQLWEQASADLGDLPAQITRGEFAGLLGWSREKVHRHGGKFTPQEMVQQVTGSKIDPAPYVRYLKEKYGEIYGL